MAGYRWTLLEVGLARRSYRDGRNEYLLNNQHVRLKDINELLAQSGLSERTYTIFGTGLGGCFPGA